MAFKGDLKSVPLGDLLQTLYQNGRSGRLELQGPDESRSIYCCPDGITIPQPEVERPRRFGDIIVAAGLVDRKTLEDLCSAMPPGRKIGEAILEAGLITQDLVDRVLRIQIEEEIYSLFDITEGAFEFFDESETDILRPELPLFSVEGVALEAARRQDEWNYIKQYIPDVNTVFFRKSESVGQVDPDGTVVLERINGQRTVRQIADNLLVSSFEVAKIMARLVEQGLVRPAEKQEMLVLAQDLLDQDEIEHAGTILKKLRPQPELPVARRERREHPGRPLLQGGRHPHGHEHPPRQGAPGQGHEHGGQQPVLFKAGPPHRTRGRTYPQRADRDLRGIRRPCGAYPAPENSGSHLCQSGQLR